MENLIYSFIGIVIGLLLAKYVIPLKAEVRQLIKTIPTDVDHLKPQYYGYKGGYNKINKCENCNLIGMYEDLHEADSCPRCGHKVKRNGSGIFQEVDGRKLWVQSA